MDPDTEAMPGTNAVENQLDISVTDGEGRSIDLSKVSSFGDLQQNMSTSYAGEQWIPTTPDRIINEASAELKLDKRLITAQQEQEDSDGNTQTASVDAESDTNTATGNDEAPKSNNGKPDIGIDRTCRYEATPPPPLPPPLPLQPVQQIPFVCLRAGMSRKASPSYLKSWIALSLTLDGRDKVTKILQYGSRLLAWYYETLAMSIGGSLLGNDATATQLLAKAQKLRGLQAKLTESRKAYRLGRSLVEMDKIRGMGWGKFLAYHLRHLVVSSDGDGSVETVMTPHIEPSDRRASNVDWGPTTTISEKGTIATAQEPNATGHTCTPHGYQRDDDKAPRLLLRRASTNIGWGPADSETTAITKPRSASFYQSVSNLGRRIYRPLASQLVASYGNKCDAAPPAWKILGSTLKILGLMGFWLGDNINFVGSSGFFDDASLPSEERAKVRAELRRKAGYFAGRAYFMGAISGLYVSFREVLVHRNGPLRRAIELVRSLEERQSQQRSIEKSQSWDMDSDQHDENDKYVGNAVGPQLALARSDLEKIKGRQFVLFLSLLKVSNTSILSVFRLECFLVALLCMRNRASAATKKILFLLVLTSHVVFLIIMIFSLRLKITAWLFVARVVAMFLSSVTILASIFTKDIAARR